MQRQTKRLTAAPVPVDLPSIPGLSALRLPCAPRPAIVLRHVLVLLRSGGLNRDLLVPPGRFFRPVPQPLDLGIGARKDNRPDPVSSCRRARQRDRAAGPTGLANRAAREGDAS